MGSGWRTRVQKSKKKGKKGGKAPTVTALERLRQEKSGGTGGGKPGGGSLRVGKSDWHAAAQSRAIGRGSEKQPWRTPTTSSLKRKAKGDEAGQETRRRRPKNSAQGSLIPRRGRGLKAKREKGGGN